MQIFYGSDIHLEHHNKKTPDLELPEGDVLILAGDVFNPWAGRKKLQAIPSRFFAMANERFKHVLYIAGNHEHYGGFFLETHDRIRNLLSPFSNIHYLNNDTFVLDGAMFFGATFWTDFRGQHPEVMWDCKRGMNDYYEIKYSEDRFNPYKSGGVILLPEDVANENHYSRQKLREFMTVAEEKEHLPIVITHHAPSFVCVEKYYRMDNLSYAYANMGLDDYLVDLFPKHIWIHGHMHKRDKIEHGNSIILTNARGYVGIESTNSFSFKQLSVEM